MAGGLDRTLGPWPDQGGYQGLAGNPQPQSGRTAVDAEVITQAVGQGVALGYQHFITQRRDATEPRVETRPQHQVTPRIAGMTCARSWRTVGSRTPKNQVIWTIFAEKKKKNFEACRCYLMKGMTDYAYSCRITIDGGIYLEQETMKSILDLRFNPGKGITYVQSAAIGLLLLCCRSCPNNETEDIKEWKLALNATEQTHQFKEYVKYVKGMVARQWASNYWDLKQNIVTYMALHCVLFGDRCDYFININNIHAVMDLPQVQQLRHKFSTEICRWISWAIIDNGQLFFNTVLTQQDFDGRRALSFPQSFLAGVLANIRFCNPIQLS
jgi:hypothetical protein